MKANLIPRSDSGVDTIASSSSSSFEGSKEPDAPPWITELSDGGGVKQKVFFRSERVNRKYLRSLLMDEKSLLMLL